MPSQETLLTIILVAIVLNLVIAVTVLVVARRDRRRAAEPIEVANARRTVAGPPAPNGSSNGPGAGRGSLTSDPLTGLDSAATWNRWLLEEDARLHRYGRPATVVLVEIDGLDRLTDRLGPGAAERIVPPVATTMRRLARQADRVARLGPARFGVLLPETDEVRAINYIERIRDAIDLWLAAGAVSLRLSIGWAEAPGAGSTDLAVQAAEARLNAERHLHPDAELEASMDQAGQGSTTETTPATASTAVSGPAGDDAQTPATPEPTAGWPTPT